MAPAPSTRTALWGECGTSAHLRTLSHCSDQAPRWVRTRERYWRTRRSDISPVRLEGRRDRRARSPGTRRQTAGRRHAVRTSRRMPYRRPQGLPRPSHRPHALPPGTNKSRLATATLARPVVAPTCPREHRECVFFQHTHLIKFGGRAGICTRALLRVTATCHRSAGRRRSR